MIWAGSGPWYFHFTYQTHFVPSPMQGFFKYYYVLDDMLDLFDLTGWARGHNLFSAPYWFLLRCTLIFQSLNYISLSAFVFQDCLGIQWICVYLCHLTNPEIH